ncbi:MAG: phosphoribosylglycinamide formyltransferase [Chitinophagaceae bacterium]|nr:phosphoribosylglycinamide formyltransferase [Chitinophagaceae bacterium]
MDNLIIFASGAGTNAAAIINWFKANGKARVSLIVCNKPQAGVLKIAERENIPTLLIDKQSIQSDEFVSTLQSHNPRLIVLAGFLWKIPATMTTAFPDKIINIHPALLPNYGGKGMYGHHVHEAVIAAGEQESGITIHYVNEAYDEGNTIVQAHCPVVAGDTPDSLAARIHKLEHYYFPRVIEFLLQH